MQCMYSTYVFLSQNLIETFKILGLKGFSIIPTSDSVFVPLRFCLECAPLRAPEHTAPEIVKNSILDKISWKV